MHPWFQGRFDDLALTEAPAPPRRSDWVLAAIFAALALAELFLTEFTWPAARAIPALIAIGLLPYRRQIPVYAAVGAFFAQFVLEVVLAAKGLEDTTAATHVIAGLMLIYAMCRWATIRLAVGGLALTLAFVLATELRGGDTIAEDLLNLLPWLVLASFALAMRYRARLGAQRATEIRLAERNALARELHDTVAHHVSAIAVQAQAAQYVALTSPEEAAKAMGAVEEIANTTIDEMRRMVGILRSDADHDRTVAPSSLQHLGEGPEAPPITFIGETSLEHLPVSIGAAIYRIAQESITNARRHSRNVTFIDVDLSTDETTATLDIINDGAPTTRNASGGFGLVGMRERTEALGGSIVAGVRPSSGWRFHATIPLNGAGH